MSLVTRGEGLTVKRQCELLGLNRTSWYYEPAVQSEADRDWEEHVKGRIDFWHTKFPWMGTRKLVIKLREDDGIAGVGRKLVRRYMREMGIWAVYPKPNLSKPGKEHKRFPYLLRRKAIWLPNQVWAIDITYIRMRHSHMYLTAVIDWYSRFIVGWALSDTLEAAPVLDAVREAISRYGIPATINSDQGSQFTSDEYIELLKSHGIRKSMDGKARWVDNVIIERWFRNLKVEEIYTNEYASPKELRASIAQYIHDYNYERPHESLGNMRPAAVYNSKFADADPQAVA